MPERLCELWDSVQANMKLSRSFFFEVVSFEKDYTGICEAFIEKLEYYGCSAARRYFELAGYKK